MANKFYPKSQLPIRKSSELLPKIFQTQANDKFLSGVVDPLIQPGSLEKTVGYIGRRYGKTYKGKDVYLDNDDTLRSRYQLEPGVIVRNQDKIEKFYDYLDLKNQLKFFGNEIDRDDLFCTHEHYSWDPPIDWDKFINYREYYWQPNGIPRITVFGQTDEVQSTYRVSLGTGPVFIFSPDGFTNNPTITLYRGQTYKFIVNVPNNGFYIRTNYDTGSLLFNPNRTYFKDQLVVFDGKLWKAKTTVFPEDGSTIDENSQDWEFVEQAGQGTALDYVKGITNNGLQSGTITFTVPFDAPETLFYQSLTEPDRFGRFIIANIESNTSINIDKEVLGKTTYRSGNSIEFTNGLMVEFGGRVTPAKYAQGVWVISGVGESIRLTSYDELTVPQINSNNPEVLFDDGGFDIGPFDDAAGFPSAKDYITIERSSRDRNPWSRYNRWFHRSVIEYAHKVNGSEFESDEALRAKRPIVEFKPDLQLIDHGAVFKGNVDFIDTVTTDIFSVIEGSRGYIVDGEPLFDGARVLFTADTDTLANNKIYQVRFIVHNGTRQISLVKVSDAETQAGEGVLVNLGQSNRGLMYHFDGTKWKISQTKKSVQQAPLFDAFDENGISFSSVETYPVSSFIGTKILGYKVGSARVDTELGFPLSYLNIDNVGDIEFEWNWEKDQFTYELDTRTFVTKEIKNGFYKFTGSEKFANGWIKTNNRFLQPIIDSKVIAEETNTVEFKTVDWKVLDDLQSRDFSILVAFYLNGKKLEADYTNNSAGTFVFDQTFAKNDVISIKIFADIDPDQGYYEIPVGIEKNPLNQDLEEFTLGTFINHVQSALEFDDRLVGEAVGVNNLRDLSDFSQNGKRFLKHGGLPALAISLLADKQSNIIQAIKFAKNSYSTFKSNFLKAAEDLFYNQDPTVFVDDILKDLTKTKVEGASFFDTDMIGCGAYNVIDYEVEDTGINTFALSEKFDLSSLSRKAVYVYINGRQQIYGKDYDFNSNFGFVLIKARLREGDKIQIREYNSTSFCFIPPTPTKLGIYKKYVPRKFLDDTYRTPRQVIQGHDGSIMTAFNDYRDDVILELELRIYNNIKQQYNSNVFDIDSVLGGYYGTGFYNKSTLDRILAKYFLNWLADSNIDYTTNSYLDSEESFTYTYSNMTTPDGAQNLPGWWRGVYLWFYDTDRPHTNPWEMLGFSEKPDWWDQEYGLPPYTRGNLLLWEDLRDGIIRRGPRAGTYDRYKRPSIINHIPVDDEGKLLSPLDSNLAQNFVLINNKGNFKIGDVAPAEHAWRSSSEYPFAISIALCLLRPFEFIPQSLDRSRITTNKIGQTVAKSTNWFYKPSDILIPGINGIQSSGMISYIVDYLKSKGLSVNILSDLINNVDVALSSRLSGFVDQENQKYILDSKTPNSTSSAVFIPVENYDIIFNVSAPISSFTYSGVILEKTDRGWKVDGYDKIDPVFNYLEPLTSQADPLITVGGVSEKFVDWAPETFFGNGIIVRYNNDFFRSVRSHKSEATFVLSNWKKIPKLPLVGGVEAFRRISFNATKIKQLSYGSEFTSIQQVVDFLLGYEAYLRSIGMIFDGYDSETQSPKDFSTSSREFMFWTIHNWAPGSLIALSPVSQSMKVQTPVGVVDSIVNDFYDYQILKSDGLPLQPNFINVKRDFQSFSIETTDINDGIFFMKIYYVLKEHVVVFDDRTVFNDVIYDKTTGYRQERIKTRGFRTVDWDGDYTSPGFLFDNVNIEVWTPFKDYKLGDIVSYQSFNWVSQETQEGQEFFDDNKWSKLDSNPTKRLVPNFDYRINQFEDYFDLDADGVSSSQRDLGRHVVGYQKRDYLQNLAEDEVTQFRLYQGFIREKGTANSLVKVFDKTSKSQDDSLVLNEEWALRVGIYGGVSQTNQVEFEIDKNKFAINPQPIIITNFVDPNAQDQYYRIDSSKFTLYDESFKTDINPQVFFEEPNRSAGYVKQGQFKFVVKNKEDILSLNIANFNDNDHVWITFYNNSWTVWRYNQEPLLVVSSVVKDKDIVTVVFNRAHNFVEGDIVGFETIPNLTGFYKIKEASFRTIKLQVKQADPDPDFDESTLTIASVFVESRFNSFDSLDDAKMAVLPEGSRLWIDGTDKKWQVIEKTKQYTFKDLLDYGITDPIGTGYRVLYLDKKNEIIASIPQSNYVMVYQEAKDGLRIKEILTPPNYVFNLTNHSFGKSIAVSPDNRFLIVGVPNASGVPSSFMGTFDPVAVYRQGEIVYFGGRLWRALVDINGDGSTINIDSEFWVPADIVEADPIGRGVGAGNQGMIAVYENRGAIWQITNIFVSPRPGTDELFGSEVSISRSGSTYYMAVSAPGALDSKGRVYLYQYDNTGVFEISAVEIIDGGSGYSDGDQLTITIGGRQAILTASTLDGEITSVGFVDRGKFITPATTTVTPEVFPLGGTGCVLSLTFSLVRRQGWKHLENQNYAGVFNSETRYPKGSIVWYENSLYEAILENVGDGSSGPTNINNWKKLDSVVTQSSLPSSVSIEDDGSTLEQGLLSSDDLAEIIKAGDKFGFSLTMSGDGSILIVGSPDSDGKYFANYRGLYNSYQEYKENDVVKFVGRYWRLQDPDTNDSSFTVKDLPPAVGSGPWIRLDSDAGSPKGKVFIYQKNSNDRYSLVQTLTADSLDQFNDLDDDEDIGVGDRFGFVVDLDQSGRTLIISSPDADINFVNQGAVYVFKTDSLSTVEFRLKQKLQSFENYSNEQFGSSTCISAGTERIVVGARNSLYNQTTKFDATLDTKFDKGRTRFIDDLGYPGRAYVFERKGNKYFLVERLEANFQNNESFGFSINCSDSAVVVGSPDYSNSGLKVGRVRLFRKDPNKDSLKVLSTSELLTDISVIRNVSLIDIENGVKIRDIDVLDPFKNKILSVADQEISYKTLYDPAIYTNGTEEQIVDQSIAWFEKNVGKIWWNLSTAKWTYYEQGDLSYRLGNWNVLAQGSTIDIYEWVETPLLPSEWSGLADTPEGIANGISGQPLYPNDDVYSVKVLFNPNTEQPTSTLYYYWVRNKSIIPSMVPGRRLAASDVASLISNPIGSGLPFIAFVDKDKLFAYNFTGILSSDRCLLNIEYVNDKKLNQVHREYQLLTEGSIDSVPSDVLETKWIDSLAGYDGAGNRVPDPQLPDRLKYGLNFRPVQSMFRDRQTALKITFDRINSILKTRAFADTINFVNLDLTDEIPSEALNLYDVAVDNYIDLQNVGTVRIREAILRANIVNGEIDTIDVIERGFGYKNTPFITIEGDGFSAQAEIIIDTQGRVSSARVINRGRRYTFANIKIRPFSVLVRADSTLQGSWSIYAWDSSRRIFYRSQSQAFNTPRYWRKIDWYADGYSENSRVTKEIPNLYKLVEFIIDKDEIVKVKEYGNGGWILLKKINFSSLNDFSDFEIVGRQQGTIEILSSLYDIKASLIGFDNLGSYDAKEYDIEPTREFRNIFRALKEDIFIDDLRIEWNNLFFAAVRYAFSEQKNIDWAFKTSFLNALHNVGPLEQKDSYQNDNLDSYRLYLDEVKPYRTSVREYTSRYTGFDTSLSATTDFDVPPSYSQAQGKVLPVNNAFNRFDEYPWKWFADNKGLEIVEIQITDPGNDYTDPPRVVIEGDGAGAKAQAFISNGKVSGIRVLDPGIGYTKTPIVSLVGGNGSSVKKAKASAVLGNSLIRSFDFTVKFDRIDKKAFYSPASYTQEFEATGSTNIFDLKYPPTQDKSKITIFRDGQLVLNNEYTISLFTHVTTYTILRGRISFRVTPPKGSKIRITFEKDAEILDSISRIEKYYKPTDGMPGVPIETDNSGNIVSRDFSQLMTGIDFGGVQIQGTTFDVTGGWDALPWFTDSWDSVQANSDFYYVADGSTQFIELPSVPESGKILSIYLKRLSDNKTVRIDDPNFVYIERIELKSDINPPINYDGSTTLTDTLEYLENAGLIPGQQGYLGRGSEIQSGWFVKGVYVQPDTRVNITRTPTNEITITGAGSIEFNQTYTRIPASLAPGYVALDYYVGKDNPDIRIFKYPNGVWFMGNNFTSTQISTKQYESVESPANIWDVDTWTAAGDAQLPTPNIQPTGHVIVRFDFTKPLLDWQYGAPNDRWQPDLIFESTQHLGPLTNPNALIPTFVGDGSTKFVQIMGFLSTAVGDTLIFRPLDSDGSVTITDVNLIDTAISGGTLSAMSGAYVTATGKTAEEIVVDGGKYISPDQVPAPEENIPGQVLDSVSIKVYNFTPAAAAPLKSRIIVSDGTTRIYDIGQKIFEPQSLTVFVDKIRQEFSGDSTINYSIDFINSKIEFVAAPPQGSVIEIISIGLGGIAILDYSEFVGDGETTLFLTRANYRDSQSILVTVDGIQKDVSFISSTGVVDTPDKVLVEFGIPPNRLQSIKVVVLGAGLDTDSGGLPIVRINEQQIVYEGSTRVFDLDNFVNLSRASALSSILVNLNGRQLKGLDTVYRIYDGVDNIVKVGVDPQEPIGTITSGNIKVYINEELRKFVVDYTYDGNNGEVILNKAVLKQGDAIRVVVDIRSEYFIEDNNLRLNPDLVLVEGDLIDVEWFSEYPSLSMISDQYTGGKIKYILSRKPLTSSYVYVYKNGNRLTLDKDYYVSTNGEVYLTEVGTLDDEIKILEFASDTYSLPSAYEINKDMLNIYRFNRYAETDIELAKDLLYYDTEIELNSTEGLFEPLRTRNIPGVVVIGAERIEYLVKEGNKLKQLRRGSQGTAIAEKHLSGTSVIDVSIGEQLPYVEDQERYDFVSDGSTVELGPLPFVPKKASRTTYKDIEIRSVPSGSFVVGQLYKISVVGTTDFTALGASENKVGVSFVATGPGGVGHTGVAVYDFYRGVPKDNGICDEIEVFVSGKRLRKDSISVYDQTKGMYSPEADVEIEAEFSVNGTTPFVRLTDALPAGTRITIIRKVGSTWYERGENSASKGITLLKNDTAIANFIKQRATKVL